MKKQHLSLDPAHERRLIAQLPGNPEAFRPLYQHYFPRIYAYVAGRVGTQQEAEDLTASIFLRAIEAIGSFDHRGAGAFAAWLFRIAYTEIQQAYRLRYRQPVVALDELPDLTSTEPPPEDALAQWDEAARLRQALIRLSPRRQEVISLRFFGGLRNHEIAAVLGLDERTVASHLCRGLDDLKALYTREVASHE